MRAFKVLFWLAFAALGLAVHPALAAPKANPELIGVERGIDRGEQNDAARQNLRILRLDVKVRAAGPMADVTLDLLIGANGQDSHTSYEGRLSLTMPNDAVVTGYALDVNGEMVPGQLLEQPKAKNVYEDRVREGIDPGLAEVSAANVFSTRIFPISASKPRRFRLSFSAPFDPARGIDLPLITDLPVGRVRLELAVESYDAPPVVRFAGAPLALRREAGQWLGSVAQDELKLAEGLSLTGGKSASKVALMRHANGRTFFVIADGIDPAKVQAAPAPGGRLRLYWDRSRSHKDAALADEQAAVLALVAAMKPEAIDLVTFAADKPAVQSLADDAALKAALAAITYRGATSLAGLDGLTLPEARLCLLVSDGQITLDQSADFDPDCRLSAISAAAGANGARLGGLTQRHQGRFVRIAPDKGGDAAAALLEASTAVIAARDGDGRRLAYRTLPAAPGSWLVVGEAMPGAGISSSEQIRLRVALSGGSTMVREYLPQEAPIQLDAPGALWASSKVDELGDDPARHEGMVRLARAFQVAGPDMAFLVLENPRQYVDADIALPKGMSADWQAEYNQIKADRAQGKSAARRERLAFVLKEWAARKEWWGTNFIAKKRREVQQREREERRESRAMAAPPPPPPPPPPPAPIPPSAPAQAVFDASERATSDIVVTAQRISNPALSAATPISVVNSAQARREVQVKLENMLADRPYLAALDQAAPEGRLKVLAAQEDQFGMTPTFYLDSAEWFRLKGDRDLALALLLSALELPTSDDETRQIVAFRLERDGYFDRAVEMAERLALGASFRPQPKRSLALALAARGMARSGKAGLDDLERAFTLLSEVALDPVGMGQGSAFDGIETIALMEANALIPAIEARGGTWQLDERLVARLDTDVRIVIEWTADDADIDLWVDEPNGERVMYSSKLSSGGGQISNDMTDGYGPEEYAIRRAIAGDYAVRINGFDADRINPNGPGHVLIRLIRNFAREDQQATLVDADIAFQQGGNRNAEDKVKPVAVLSVGNK